MPSAFKLAVSCQLSAVSLIFIILSLFLTPTPTFAAIKLNGAENIGSNNWTAATQTTFSLDNMIGGGLSILAGQSPYDKTPTRIQADNGQIKLVLFDKVPSGGAIGGITNLTLAMYSPPTSSIEYLAHLGENIGIAPKPAYAQVTGSGESIIKPVLKLWLATRNIAYLLFIAVFIVIGFLIMFKHKINPQTTITAQAALPGLIISLILVTFSYFIAALLVDLSFVGVKLITEIFIQATDPEFPNVLGNAQQLKSMADNSNLLQLFSSSAGVVLENTGSVAGSITNTTRDIWAPLTLFIPAVIGGILGFFVGGPFGAVLGAVGGGATGAASEQAAPLFISGLLSLILVVALFIQMFRLFLGLLGAYIQILVNVILGPFIILFSAIPGNGAQLNNWFMSILANALIFPAVIAIFLFAGFILGNTNPDDWRVSPPLFGGLTAELLRVVLAYGIILAVPIIPETIRNALKVKGPQGFDKAAIGGFMGGLGVAQGGYNKWVEPQKQIQKAWGEANVKATAGVGPAVPARPQRRFPWIY